MERLGSFLRSFPRGGCACLRTLQYISPDCFSQNFGRAFIIANYAIASKFTVAVGKKLA